MTEIEQLDFRHKFTVVSTFSGCGGSCLGLRRAGFKILWANEFIPEARATYLLNHPTPIVDPRDIREITPEMILSAINRERGDIDLMEGSPPCSAFSTSGLMREGWGMKKTYSDAVQRVDDLFFEYIRILKGLQPRTFVAENVVGLGAGPHRGLFSEIVADLRAAGYEVAVKGLDFQWFGVPQRRKRLIFVGVRNDLGIDPVFPVPERHNYVLADIFPYVRKFHRGGKDGEGNPRSWHNAKDLPYSTITDNAGRTSINACFSANGFVELHSGEKRRLTIDEVKILSCLPPDFELTGSFGDQWERAARCVPPEAMYRIGKTIRDMVLEKALAKGWGYATREKSQGR